MSRFHTDPKREDDTYALPDCETFHMSKRDIRDLGEDGEQYRGDDGQPMPGWYVWACFPGCLPDGDPIGPYKTEDEAIDVNEILSHRQEEFHNSEETTDE